MIANAPRTMFQKVWDQHIVHSEAGQQTILYIDLHLVHEVTSPQAFEGLRLAGRKVWRTSSILAVSDHNVPTTSRAAGIEDDVVAAKSIYTQPEEVEDFVKKTGVDSLAISIGTSHGAYKFKPTI